MEENLSTSLDTHRVGTRKRKENGEKAHGEEELRLHERK